MKITSLFFCISASACVLVPGSSNAAQPPSPVTVVNTPAVLIANGPENPVRVVDGNARSREIVQVSAQKGSMAARVLLYHVPDGKRLVIEDVSIASVLPAGQQVFASIRTVVNGQQNDHFFGTNMAPSGCSFVCSVSGGRQTRIYADAGTDVYGDANHSEPTPPDRVYYFTINGYLEAVE